MKSCFPTTQTQFVLRVGGKTIAFHVLIFYPATCLNSFISDHYTYFFFLDLSHWLGLNQCRKTLVKEYIFVLFQPLIRMLLMLCHQIGWKYFISLKKFLSISSLLRSVLFTGDYTRFFSRGLRSFPYVSLENPEMVLSNWDLPALTSQLSHCGLELSSVIASLCLHSLTLDPGWPKERRHSVLTFSTLP